MTSEVDQSDGTTSGSHCSRLTQRLLVNFRLICFCSSSKSEPPGVSPLASLSSDDIEEIQSLSLTFGCKLPTIVTPCFLRGLNITPGFVRSSIAVTFRLMLSQLPKCSLSPLIYQSSTDRPSLAPESSKVQTYMSLYYRLIGVQTITPERAATLHRSFLLMPYNSVTYMCPLLV
ncbi:unnamed protein product [Heterobilharzia americana]|nr:unnamed protein product [Heterobilharzia americana]